MYQGMYQLVTHKWNDIKHKVDEGMSDDRVPLPPTVELVNWVSDEYTEPCPRCGGGHADRTKYVCAECNRLFCVRYVRKIKTAQFDQPVLQHVVVWKYHEELSRTWCGPVDEVGVWDPIVDRLIEIVEDLGC